MTIASTNTYEFDIGKIVLAGYRYALLVPAGVALKTIQLTEGTDALQRIMQSLDGKGVRLNQVRYDYLTLTADSEWLELPADVWDVGPTAMYISADEANAQQANNEVPVHREYREEFQRRGSKGATSDTPTRFRLDKEQTPYRLELDPIPNEAGTLRVECYKLSADSRNANDTPDIERHWAECLCYGIAAEVATMNGVDLQRVQYLAGRFEAKKKEAMGQSKDVVSRQFELCHRTPWSRR